MDSNLEQTTEPTIFQLFKCFKLVSFVEHDVFKVYFKFVNKMYVCAIFNLKFYWPFIFSFYVSSFNK